MSGNKTSVYIFVWATMIIIFTMVIMMLILHTNFMKIESAMKDLQINSYSEPIKVYVESPCSCQHDEPEIVEDAIAPTSFILESRYGFTDEEKYLLAQLLCGSSSIDGDGEYDFVWSGVTYDNLNWTEICKVLCVVMNRVNSDIYPDNVTDVVLQKGQFSVMPKNVSTTPDDLALEVVTEWCNLYDMGDESICVIPETHLYFHSGPNNTNVTREKWK